MRRGSGGFSRGFGRGYDSGGRGGAPDYESNVSGRGSSGNTRPIDPHDRACSGRGGGRGRYAERERGTLSLQAQTQGMGGMRMEQYPPAGKMSFSLPGVPLSSYEVHGTHEIENLDAAFPMTSRRLRPVSMPVPDPAKRGNFDRRTERRSRSDFDFDPRSRPVNQYDLQQVKSSYSNEIFESGNGNKSGDKYTREQEESFRVRARGGREMPKRRSSDGMAKKSPNESSPEYFSTNYPTMELHEEFDPSRHETESSYRSREEHGDDEFEFDDQPEGDGDRYGKKPSDELSDTVYSAGERKIPSKEMETPNEAFTQRPKIEQVNQSQSSEDSDRYIDALDESQRRATDEHLTLQQQARNSPVYGCRGPVWSRREDNCNDSERYGQDAGVVRGESGSGKQEHPPDQDSPSRDSSLQQDLPGQHQHNPEVSSNQRQPAAQQEQPNVSQLTTEPEPYKRVCQRNRRVRKRKEKREQASSGGEVNDCLTESSKATEPEPYKRVCQRNRRIRKRKEKRGQTLSASDCQTESSTCTRPIPEGAKQ